MIRGTMTAGGFRRIGFMPVIFGSVLFWTVSVLFAAGSALGAPAPNRLLAVKMEDGAASPTVLVQAAEAIGYRYTVYESFDPVRIVVDLPGMDSGGVAGKAPASPAPLRELRTTNFELASGRLARIEIVLDANAEYKVVTDDGNLRIVFPKLAGQPQPVSLPKTTASGTTANSISNVTVAPGRLLLSTTGEVGRFEHFTLENPPRLIVDLYGLRPEFKPRTFDLSAGMRQASVGVYGDKVRFVFDADGTALPEHTVEKQSGGLVVVWGRGLQGTIPAVAVTPAAATVVVAPSTKLAKQPVPADRQVVVEGLDFVSRDGRSYVVTTLSAPASIVQPVQDGNLVRFEIRNATISRSLRRSIDASAFPSAIKSITPYVLTDGGKPVVRIAVDLKDNAPFILVDEGETVKLVVDDGAYAEAEPPEVSSREVITDAAPATETYGNGDIAGADEIKRPRYTGQKISLVFDNADIRSILQLIGDVSGYNILAGPDVKGEITLRLIDVPWDQALKLVSDTMQLKTVIDGNVMQIYSVKGFTEMKQAELDAKVAESKAAGAINVRRVLGINHVNMDTVNNLAKSYAGVVVNVDKNTKKVILSGNSTDVDSLAEAITQVDRPERQVLIEARIIEASTDFSRELGVNWGAHYNNETLNGGVAGYGDNANLGLGGSFLLDAPLIGTSSGAALGVTFGRILEDTIVIDARLSAFESQGEVKILSTPKITTINGAEAEVTQGREIPYTVTTQDGPDTQFKEAKLSLKVTPEINPNSSLILTIEILNDSAGPPVPTANGTQLSIEKKSAKTKLILKSGETTVVGGVYVDSEDTSESGVPFLKDIPYLGHLFKSNRVKKERRELLIMITPRVLDLDT